MRTSATKAAAPHLVDVAVNLTDCVFRGVDWSGKRIHEDDFELMMNRAEQHGVRQMIITGTNLLQCEKAISLCRRYPNRRLVCTVGVHPAHSCEFARPMPDAETIAAFVVDDSSVVEPTNTAKEPVSPEEEASNAAARLAHLVRLVEENRDIVVAVGEIGIDYAELLYCPREVQEKYFAEQLRAFAPLGLPFLYHSRDCGMHFCHTLATTVMENPSLFHRAGANGSAPGTSQPLSDGAPPQLHGVVHSFNGSQEEQDALLSMGLYLSLNGSAFRTREMAMQAITIPRERLMLETDAPWCDIRKKDFCYRHVKTHFDTVKRSKPFVPGKCVERRNEPCHLVQVIEAYLGCLHAEQPETVDTVTREAFVETLHHNCKTAFDL